MAIMNAVFRFNIFIDGVNSDEGKIAAVVAESFGALGRMAALSVPLLVWTLGVILSVKLTDRQTFFRRTYWAIPLWMVISTILTLLMRALLGLVWRSSCLWDGCPRRADSVRTVGLRSWMSEIDAHASGNGQPGGKPNMTALVGVLVAIIVGFWPRVAVIGSPALQESDLRRVSRNYAGLTARLSAHLVMLVATAMILVALFLGLWSVWPATSDELGVGFALLVGSVFGFQEAVFATTKGVLPGFSFPGFGTHFVYSPADRIRRNGRIQLLLTAIVTVGVIVYWLSLWR